MRIIQAAPRGHLAVRFTHPFAFLVHAHMNSLSRNMPITLRQSFAGRLGSWGPQRDIQRLDPLRSNSKVSSVHRDHPLSLTVSL